MNPLEMMYSWQALLCAAACVSLTKLVKTVLDLSMGKEKRKANRWVTKLVLPMTPVIVGLVYAIVVPLRPEILLSYAETHLSGVWLYLGYAGWGAACGQFSTMLHGKAMDLLETSKASA